MGACGQSSPRDMEPPGVSAQRSPMSPTVLDVRGFRFFFYSRESTGGGLEPPHVHVRKGGGEAKVWIDLNLVEHARGFSPGELRTIREIVARERTLLIEAWNEYFREPPGQGGGGDRT